MSTNVFNEESVEKPNNKVVPWPIKLALRYGAKSEKQANTIVIIISAILLLATVIIYKQFIFSSNETAEITLEDLSPRVQKGIRDEKPGELNVNDLLPSEREELERMGVEF